MKVVNLFFVLGFGVLVAIPSVGLAINFGASVAAVLASTGNESAAGILRSFRASAIDQFVGEHFGRRDTMIAANARLKAALGEPSPRIAFGADGFLFLRDHDTFRQMTGERLDHASLSGLLRLVREIDNSSKSHGRKFVFLLAPNSHGVYRHLLPAWARRVPAVTEADLILADVAALGVKTIDPRQALAGYARTEAVYWHADTHWTNFGIVVVFDLLADAVGYGASGLDVETVFHGQDDVERLGDLARIAGFGDLWPDRAPKLIGPDPFSGDGLIRDPLVKDGQEIAAHVRFKDPARHADGPRLLILGDSFTRLGFCEIAMRFASQCAWIFHDRGHFDPSMVEELNPDIVIMEVVERNLNWFEN